MPRSRQIGLWRYELVFIAAPEHPVTDYPNDLAQQPFILYQRAFPIEEAIRRFCVEVVMQNGQADSMKELVKLGRECLCSLCGAFRKTSGAALRMSRPPSGPW
jgi:DNA-binding transcriptional LysR family regulator